MGYLEVLTFFSATISRSVLIFMVYARQRTGLLNRNFTERNFKVVKKKFELYKCCETFCIQVLYICVWIYMSRVMRKPNFRPCDNKGANQQCSYCTAPLYSSLNIFIALIKHGVGPQVFPTLVTALPLQCTYKT